MADQAAQAVHDRRALTVTLIVVSGAPGTGKSTIAAALGAALRFPVLTLDPIKEALADVLGLGGEDWSNQVGDAAAEVVFRLAAAFPDAVAEGWWRGSAPGPGAGRVRRRDRGVLPLRSPAGRGPGQGPDRPRPAPHSPRRDQPRDGGPPRRTGGDGDAAAARRET